MMLRASALLLLLAAGALAGDRDFDQIVKAVGAHYHARPTRIPLMGVARFFVHTARPEGVSGFHIAIFEDLAAPDDEDASALDRAMACLSPRHLHPFVQVRSRGGESTYIYAGAAGKTTTLLIAACEPTEASVIEVQVSLDVLRRCLAHPGEAAGILGVERSQDPDRDR